MNGDLISVIVPVYKVEMYLPKCIESILSQTYTNLEVILVDDGSPDRCGEICDHYASTDERVVVIHKSNGGLSNARNAGLDICKGMYVSFVDSDDSIEPEYIEYLYSLIKENGADLSICEYKYITEHGKLFNQPCNSGDILIMDTQQALQNLCYGSLFFDSAWAKLYKTSFFSEIRYPDGKIFEDIPTTYQLIMKSTRIVLGQRALYNYLFRTNAISKQPFNMCRMDALVFTEEMCNTISKAHPELSEACQQRLFRECVYIFKSLCSGNGFYSDIKHSVYQKIISSRKNIDRSKLTPKLLCYFWASYFGIRFLTIMTLMETRLSRSRMRRK